MYNTGFMATLSCCQQILLKMKPAGRDRIINMGAQSTTRGMPFAGAYCTSKAHVRALTKIIALEKGRILRIMQSFRGL
jgi:NAD(P)-dependent dehydrogenase (short-subunit alcohol dehydrogenase family)